MTEFDSAAAKVAARRQAVEARILQVCPTKEARANRNLLACFDRVDRNLPVSGYLSIGSEINPIATMTTLHEAGMQLSVPVVVGPHCPLKFLQWTPETPLVSADFGVSIPTGGTQLTPGVLIVPLLTFDSQGFRLGYGGGFYDRTLDALRSERPSTVAIGFAYSGQEVASVPKDQLDQPLNLVVTDLGVVEFGDSGFS